MNYTNSDLTQWFDGKLYKPARRGPYVSKYRSCIGYRYWTGVAWGTWFGDLKDAVDDSLSGDFELSRFQDADWRGLRNKP